MSILSSIGSFITTVKTDISNIIKSEVPTANIKNVLPTVKAAVTGQGVTANTNNPTLNKVLSTVASNPFTTAALITPINTIGAVKAGFSSLSTTAKVLTGAGVIASIPAIVNNPKLVSSAFNAPSNISQFSGNIGTFTANPTLQNVGNIFSENPFLSGVAVAGAGLLIGKSVSGIANTIAIAKNTAATNKAIDTMTGTTLTNIIPESSKNLLVTQKEETAMATNRAVPITPETQIIGKPANTSVTTYKHKKTNTVSKNGNNQVLRVNIFNQSKLQNVKYLNTKHY